MGLRILSERFKITLKLAAGILNRMFGTQAPAFMQNRMSPNTCAVEFCVDDARQGVPLPSIAYTDLKSKRQCDAKRPTFF